VFSYETMSDDNNINDKLNNHGNCVGVSNNFMSQFYVLQFDKLI
jgi:hypothetical protein